MQRKHPALLERLPVYATFSGIYENLPFVNRSKLTEKEAFDE